MMWFGDKIALSQRMSTKTFSGSWEAVGGKVEDDEHIIHGIQREIMEEMHLFVQRHELELLECITNDPTTDACYIFSYETFAIRFNDVMNREKKKRTTWQLFTIEEALKLPNLMPGLRENIKKRKKHLSMTR